MEKFLEHMNNYFNCLHYNFLIKTRPMNEQTFHRTMFSINCHEIMYIHFLSCLAIFHGHNNQPFWKITLANKIKWKC